MKKIVLALALLLSAASAACGAASVSLRRVSDATFEKRQFEVAALGQDSFRVASGLASVAASAEYAGLTGDTGNATVLAESVSGCYLAVVTTNLPLAETDVAAFNLDGERVNNSVQRNDSYRTSGMAVRGFCLTARAIFTVRIFSSRPAMGFLLALYPIADAEAIVSSVERLQNIDRRALQNALEQIVRQADSGATQMPWAAEIPNFLSQREMVTSGLPAGAAQGMCLLLAVSGSGGSSRDVNLAVYTGTPPVTQENILASDLRVNPNAAVVFTVPADPSTVHVIVQSYAGAGPIVYGVWRVREALCGANAPPVELPTYRSNASRNEVQVKN